MDLSHRMCDVWINLQRYLRHVIVVLNRIQGYWISRRNVRRYAIGIYVMLVLHIQLLRVDILLLMLNAIVLLTILLTVALTIVVLVGRHVRHVPHRSCDVNHKSHVTS